MFKVFMVLLLLLGELRSRNAQDFKKANACLLKTCHVQSNAEKVGALDEHAHKIRQIPACMNWHPSRLHVKASAASMSKAHVMNIGSIHAPCLEALFRQDFNDFPLCPYGLQDLFKPISQH